MKMVRDIALTLVVLSLLAAGVVAIPILFVIGAVALLGAVAYLIYAYIHDAGLEAERRIDGNDD